MKALIETALQFLNERTSGSLGLERRNPWLLGQMLFPRDDAETA